MKKKLAMTLCGLWLLSACGQSGPLVLPDSKPAPTQKEKKQDS